MLVKKKSTAFTMFAFIVCIIFGVLSVFPFLTMVINATRSRQEIMRASISLLPSLNIVENFKYLAGYETFNALVGFKNSAIVASGATICSIYFSCLTAYAIVAYEWRFRDTFYAIILGIMMIPAQVSAIGFYQFMLMLGLNNNYIPFIIPAIASPAVVFFMRQYLLAAVHLDIVSSARIDGATEFKTFNSIIIPLMKPAIATQAIFVFVGSWNNYFLPLILLTNSSMWTMPRMVGTLYGNIYSSNYGAIYLALTLSVLPIFIIYFMLSKYIIAGVALGGIKE